MLLLFIVNMCGCFFKREKGITNTKASQEILNESSRKRNKTLVDKGSKFYNRQMISCLQDNDIGRHSTHTEGKSVTAERFIRTL